MDATGSRLGRLGVFLAAISFGLGQITMMAGDDDDDGGPSVVGSEEVRDLISYW